MTTNLDNHSQDKSNSELVQALAIRYQAIRDKISEAAHSIGRDPQTIQLLAVSKGQSVEKIATLASLGQTSFGENYTQEMLTKAQALSHLSVRWSYIGKIQSNKIHRIVEVASEIQTLTDLRHAKLIAQAAREIGKVPYPVYLEVNASMEATKGGLTFENVIPFWETLQVACPELKVMGIMAIPAQDIQDPPLGLPLHVPTLYNNLRQLAHKIGDGKLSLGMSGDLQTAVQAGSDVVRIGTALFGERLLKKNDNLQA